MPLPNIASRKPLASAPGRSAPPPPETRRPHTIWATDTEWARVQRLGITKQEETGRVGRKALMLGVSILESGLGVEASIAGVGR